MADHSHIEWTDATWNPITGCSVVSPGCTNCYAMKLAGTRLQHHRSRAGLTVASKAGPVWTGEVRLNEEWLGQPLHWRRPRRIFVCAHGDLFHESVPFAWIDRVFGVMAAAPWHTFQVLTKRADRMRAYLSDQSDGRMVARMEALIPHPTGTAQFSELVDLAVLAKPLPNVWLGVSVEDEIRALRVLDLLETPAAVRYVSYEPALSYVDFRSICHGAYFVDALAGLKFHDAPDDGPPGATAPHARLDQVIMGGESGPDARPMHTKWAEWTERDCRETGVAFFFKQWGGWAPTLSNDGEWPADAPGHIRLTVDGRRAPDGWPMQLVGKKASGRLLNGTIHDGMPEARA